MFRIIILAVLVVLILYFLKKKSKLKINIYGKLIPIVIILVILFLVATSGKFILPQILQIIKIGLPFITKLIGL